MRAVLLGLSLFLLASCSKEYNIELPPHKKQLVVECYLEDGQPFRALLSESTELLDTSLIPPVFINALVTITHRGRIDTLRPFVYVDIERRRAYNYGSPTLATADYAAGGEYRIDAWDSAGRYVWGTTQFLRPVAITSITPVFDQADTSAYTVTEFPDDPNTKNWYRLVTTRNIRNDSISQNRLFDETFVNDKGNIVFGSRYQYKHGDSVHATLFHLTEAHYNYLNTQRNARGALVNPFAVSGEVISNINGGLGIFAALSTTQKSIFVP